jgi:hypothetical protein
LPTGRLFGRITQKGPNKKIERPNIGILGDFVQTIDPDNFFPKAKINQIVKIGKGPDFVLSGRAFLPDWPESSATSWQYYEQKRVWKRC